MKDLGKTPEIAMLHLDEIDHLGHTDARCLNSNTLGLLTAACRCRSWSSTPRLRPQVACLCYFDRGFVDEAQLGGRTNLGHAHHHPMLAMPWFLTRNCDL
jgi:hypothetical protein